MQVAWPCSFGGLSTVGVLVAAWPWLCGSQVLPRERKLLMSVSRLHSGTAGTQSGECRSCAGEDGSWCEQLQDPGVYSLGAWLILQASGRESWGWCFQLVGGVRTQGGPLPCTGLQVGESGSQPAGVWGCVPTHLALDLHFH